MGKERQEGSRQSRSRCSVGGESRSNWAAGSKSGGPQFFFLVLVIY